MDFQDGHCALLTSCMVSRGFEVTSHTTHVQQSFMHQKVKVEPKPIYPIFSTPSTDVVMVICFFPSHPKPSHMLDTLKAYV